MSSSFITAPRIHDGRSWLPEGSVLELAADGMVLAVHPDDRLAANVLRCEGILAPGFVNAHCHLELSHMKDMVPRETGLIPFLQAVMRQRNDFTEEQKKAARHEACSELARNGTVAVGDVANTTDTLDLRRLGKMHIHTFAESTGFVAATAPARFEVAQQVFTAFKKQSQPADILLRQSLSPHAPYSVSERLFRLIDAAEPGSLIFIHNGESLAEDEYYRQKTGPVKDLLRGFGIDDSAFQPSGKDALQTYIAWLSPEHPMLFVHNTYTGRMATETAQSRFPQASWCLCPGANLHIEGRLPNVPLFFYAAQNICIGTDSLASNSGLNILSELLLLKEAFPVLEWETLLRWGTLGGAVALRMDDVIGSLEPGKKPGIIQITGLDEGKAQTNWIRKINT